MVRRVLLLATLVVTGALVFAACGGDDNSSAPAPAPESVPAATEEPSADPAAEPSVAAADDPEALLRAALTNMTTLASVHAAVTLAIDEGGEALIEGDFTQTTADLTVTQVGGDEVQVKADGSDVQVSVDGGVTFAPDETGQFTGVAVIATAPLDLGLLDQGDVVTIGPEEVDGKPAVHLQVGGVFDVWVDQDAAAGAIMRKIEGRFEANDIPESDMSVTYTDHTAS